MQNKINRLTATLTLAAGTILAGNALACNEQSYLGMVCLTSAVYCPAGWVPADGSTSPSQILNAVTGKTTVPSLQAPAGTRYCVSVSGPFPPRP